MQGIILQQEQPLLRAPLEGTTKVFRATQRGIERQLKDTQSRVSKLSSSSSTMEPSKIKKEVEDMIKSLHGLKRKLAETRKYEENYYRRSRRRIDHLQEVIKLVNADQDAENKPEVEDAVPTSENSKAVVKIHPSLTHWNQTRLNRLLVDQMLRDGCFDSANIMAKLYNIEDLVDIEIFESSKKIIASLKEKSATEALKWCAENRTQLKKQNSKLEFSLRIQEFVEFVRVEKHKDAIAYARKFFSSAECDENEVKEFRKAMALLAFKPSTKCPPYKDLFDPRRWDKLIDMFKKDTYAFYGLPTVSLLAINMQVGLASLKTAQCYQESKKKGNCPVCQSPYNEIAALLPFALHMHSNLICPITGEIMNDENPPMALPNGYVYSTSALEQMAAEDEEQLVTCINTKERFPLSQARKVFIS